jgi:hypothetical protein
VLVVLDAEGDCPVERAAESVRRANGVLPGLDPQVVVANRMFEAWLVAAAGSLAGRRGLLADLSTPLDPDEIRNPKLWLSESMLNGRYHEVSDQPALTALFDIQEARKASRSFRKIADAFRRIAQDAGAPDAP